MGIPVTGFAFPVTFVRQDGPHQQWVRSAMFIPTGTAAVSSAVGAYAGPVDFVGEGGFSQTFLHVSGQAGLVFSVYGTFSEPSTTPTDRVWLIMRGDTATGTNAILNAITCGGEVILQNPARSYMFRVSGANAGMATGVAINVLQIKSNG